jgi:FkbM family methyltransferase
MDTPSKKFHFLDIGANIGQTFDWYLLPVHDYDGWHIWCFEPSPRNLPALIEKARELAGRYKITVCPFGIGGNHDATRIYETSNPVGDSFLKKYWAGEDESKNIETLHEIVAATVPLGQFILANTAPGDKVVLKLDCEGSEYAALKSLIAEPEALARCSRIMVEWHNTKLPDDNPETFEALFASAGHPLEKWKF